MGHDITVIPVVDHDALAVVEEVKLHRVDAAGVPKGSFYNHFDSKEGFAAVIIGNYIQYLFLIMLALPLDDSSRAMFGAREFARCKKSALLVNVARGGVTDQAALRDALAGGIIAGAAVDVTEPEPLPPEHPLWDAPNLILTPHYAGACGPIAGERMAQLVGANIERFMKGEAPENLVLL